MKKSTITVGYCAIRRGDLVELGNGFYKALSHPIHGTFTVRKAYWFDVLWYKLTH